MVSGDATADSIDEEFNQIPQEALPRHIAIIMDGNRRWALRRGLEPTEGHRAGSERVRELALAGKELGIEAITLWGFSTENWSRSKAEVKFLINLFIRYARKFRKEFLSENVRFRHLGRKDRLPRKLMDIFFDLEEKTKNYDRSTFAIALDYGGTDEVVRAIQQIIKDGVPASKVNEELIMNYLDTSGLPKPDMIIRTSGEQRTSGFLPLQSTYAELFMIDDLFPDFTSNRLKELIIEYTKRNRRFGGGRYTNVSQVG